MQPQLRRMPTADDEALRNLVRKHGLWRVLWALSRMQREQAELQDAFNRTRRPVPAIRSEDC